MLSINLSMPQPLTKPLFAVLTKKRGFKAHRVPTQYGTFKKKNVLKNIMVLKKLYEKKN
jgi:hypothetical protein